MVQRRRPSGFIEPCQPSKVTRPLTGPLWVHEIKLERSCTHRNGRYRCYVND
jgi:hypothetical protein